MNAFSCTRSHRRHRRAASLIGLAAVGVSGLARAQVSDAFTVRYSAPATCPDQQAFVSQVLARTARARLAQGDEPARAFEIQVEARFGDSRGVLVVAADGQRTQREVSAASCAEVVQALALVAALTIDPEARTGDLSAPTPPPAATPPELDLAPAPAAASPLTTAPEPSTPSEHARPRATPPSTPRTERPTLPSLSLGAQGEIVSAPAPEPMRAARLWVALDSGRAGVLSPSAGASFAAGRSLTQATTADAAFTWVAMRLDGCPFDLVPGERLALRPCLSVDVGALHGEGRPRELERVDPEQALTLWASAGALLRADVRLFGPLRVRLESSAFLPFYSETRFSFATRRDPGTEQVHDVPAAGVSVGAGLGLSFR